jgi:integrase/recombinase XerD
MADTLMTTQGIYTNTHTIESKVALAIEELINRFKLSNVAASKSEKTTEWYDDILKLFLSYLETKHPGPDLSIFNITTVRHYILYLPDKKKFEGHPYTPVQNDTLSPRTIQDNVRVVKVFSSWLYTESYTEENRLKNLKLPKAPATIVEPLSAEEVKAIFASVNKNSPIGFRNHVILLTILDTGLRAFEAAGICLGNINVDDGYIQKSVLAQ